tara:strand:- start:8369 stop:9028 length:660 start_codon:yes stop_codon:yes gene_type:complete
MKRTLLFLAALAIVLPASATLIFDLNLEGGIFGSGHIGFDATSITEFELTIESIDPSNPDSAPLPFTFVTADIEAAQWYVNDGVLDFLDLDTFTVLGANPDHQYDLSLSFARSTPARKRTAVTVLPNSLGDLNVGELGGTLNCGIAMKKKAPRKTPPPTPIGSGYVDLCSSTLDADNGRVLALSAGNLSSPLAVPEPPVLALIAFGLLMVRLAARRIRR